MEGRDESRLSKLPSGVDAFRGAHLNRLFPRSSFDVLQRLAVIKEMFSTGHVHLEARRRRRVSWEYTS